MLGDNIFFGHGFQDILGRAAGMQDGGVIFGYWVRDPERYGVVAFDEDKKVVNVEEKPQNPKSHYAVVGLYYFDNDVIEIARNLKPSERGEYEMADVINAYIQRGDLSLEILRRGFAWLDTGTHDSMLSAANFVEAVEKRQGLKIACIEEVAFRMGFIDYEQLIVLADEYPNNPYGDYIRMVAEE